MYGHHYSAQTIYNITKLVEEDVKAFHERQVKSRYVAIFCDATFISVRRDSVSREAVHVLIGIDYEGKKEVLDYNIYPTESKNNYKEMLEDLKTRGLNHVLLFVSDDLTQLEEAVLESFPMAKHQACWTHLSRNVLNKVRVKDKAEVGEDFKKIHQAKNLESALEKYNEFLEKWSNRYPKVKKALEKYDNLFTYLEFPKEIQRSIYTNDIDENFNKQIKKKTKVKEQFPNEDSLDRTICTVAMEYNEKFGNRVHKYYGLVRDELEEIYEKTLECQ